MVSGKKLLEMARKWRRLAIARRRKTASIRRVEIPSAEECCSPSIRTAHRKGMFAVYSRDGSRFVIPLTYLDSSIFRELLLMSEEEFGLPSAGPIVIPCDAALLAQIVSQLRRRSSLDAQRAVIAVISGNRCTSSTPTPRGIDLRPPTISVY